MVKHYMGPVVYGTQRIYCCSATFSYLREHTSWVEMVTCTRCLRKLAKWVNITLVEKSKCGGRGSRR